MNDNDYCIEHKLNDTNDIEIMFDDDVKYLNFLNDIECAPNGEYYSEIISRGFDINDNEMLCFIYPIVCDSSMFNSHDITQKINNLVELALDNWGFDKSQDVKKINMLNSFLEGLKFSRIIDSLLSFGKKDTILYVYEIVSQHVGEDQIINSNIFLSCW